MKRIILTAVLALAPFLPAVMSPADAKHAKPRPHHAHIDKNPRTVDVHVSVPARLMAPKPAANHGGRHSGVQKSHGSAARPPAPHKSIAKAKTAKTPPAAKMFTKAPPKVTPALPDWLSRIFGG